MTQDLGQVRRPVQADTPDNLQQPLEQGYRQYTAWAVLPQESAEAGATERLGGRPASWGMGAAAAAAAGIVRRGVEAYWMLVVPGVVHRSNKPRASNLVAVVVQQQIADAPQVALGPREGKDVGQKADGQRVSRTPTCPVLAGDRM